MRVSGIEQALTSHHIEGFASAIDRHDPDVDGRSKGSHACNALVFSATSRGCQRRFEEYWDEVDDYPNLLMVLFGRRRRS